MCEELSSGEGKWGLIGETPLPKTEGEGPEVALGEFLSATSVLGYP